MQAVVDMKNRSFYDALEMVQQKLSGAALKRKATRYVEVSWIHVK